MPQSNEDDAPKEKEASGPIDLEAAIRDKLLARDKRYQINAYRFVYEALERAQALVGRDPRNEDAEKRHVSGKELLAGVRDLAREEFGPLAPVVFRSWGVRSTEDFGEIVFSLLEAGLMGKTDSDTRQDFANGYDFDEAFDGPVRTK